MRIVSNTHQINNKQANGIMECTFIVHPKLQPVVEKRIADIGTIGNCKINYINEFDLLNLKLTDLIGKRIAICTTVPVSETVEVAKKYEGMSLVLSKMNLPEFMDFGFKK